MKIALLGIVLMLGVLAALYVVSQDDQSPVTTRAPVQTSPSDADLRNLRIN